MKDRLTIKARERGQLDGTLTVKFRGRWRAADTMRRLVLRTFDATPLIEAVRYLTALGEDHYLEAKDIKIGMDALRAFAKQEAEL